MSSIAEKSTTISHKRSFFLRTSSIQKIKCSATYPFRLAGTKLSKDAIKQLLETLIIYIFGAIWVGQSAKRIFNLTGLFGPVQSIVPPDSTKEKKTETSALGFHERLLIKVQNSQAHKRKIEQKNVELIGKREKQTQTIENENVNITEFHAELAKLRKYSSELSLNRSNGSASLTDFRHAKQSCCFTVFVHASMAFVYLQLLILTLALNTAQLPPGLLFMISSLLFIAVIVFKILHRQKITKCVIRSTGKSSQRNERTSSKQEEPVNNTKIVNRNTRESRSRRRMNPAIDLSNKTLSKIKLL